MISEGFLPQNQVDLWGREIADHAWVRLDAFEISIQTSIVLNDFSNFSKEVVSTIRNFSFDDIHELRVRLMNLSKKYK